MYRAKVNTQVTGFVISEQLLSLATQHALACQNTQIMQVIGQFPQPYLWPGSCNWDQHWNMLAIFSGVSHSS